VNYIWTQLLRRIGPYVIKLMLRCIPNRLHFARCSFALAALCTAHSAIAQNASTNLAHHPLNQLVSFVRGDGANQFALVDGGHVVPIYVPPGSPDTVLVVAQAFAHDLEAVSGIHTRVLTSIPATPPSKLVIAGVIGQSTEIDRMRADGKLHTDLIEGKWESAITSVVQNPIPGVQSALVIAGSDRRGAAFALFTLSRQMGVSPWTWWADVPIERHRSVFVSTLEHLQPEPSVQYRGIFLNDEDWGLRPWAAKKMDPTVDKGNIGPCTYERIFELLLRLRANSLWPAMHPGSLPFNAVPENARLADEWGIVMGSSHSEALLRNNVGEWNEKIDGPWNYQINAPAMNAYWDKRLAENGKYENYYTVGLRGVHDSGLEATGSPEVKAKLVEDVMTEQRKLLAARVHADVTKIPQIIWLYKESLDLYRVGMKVPPDVTLGWTDDNYGYIRELPNAQEQTRPGGSGVYYHVSYWGAPHDHLWLCTTPPSLIREEMTKAYDHHARRYWILNVGDLKPAEVDIDYFMQLASDEPKMAPMSQRDFLTQWFAEQFPTADAAKVANVLTLYYGLNFIRKPEFMGFNGYNDNINRTAFNPLAWPSDGQPDQNRARAAAWSQLQADEQAVAKTLPPHYASAFFELVGYPVEGSAAMNHKFLSTDLSYLDSQQHNFASIAVDAARAKAAYETIQTLTGRYNSLEDGKWDGIMSAAPRERHVFEMPHGATGADAEKPLPATWGTGEDAANTATTLSFASSGFTEQHATVSINAAHFARKQDGKNASWQLLPDLGISGASVGYGAPGSQTDAESAALSIATAPWLDYDFDTTSSGAATLTLALLPTFPVDSQHRMRYAVSLDGQSPLVVDASDRGEWRDNAPPNWTANVLRNFATTKIPLGSLHSGHHTLRLIYMDPAIIFEHIVVSFPGAPPAYPVPPETVSTNASHNR
jgi:hypothetical protein